MLGTRVSRAVSLLWAHSPSSRTTCCPCPGVLWLFSGRSPFPGWMEAFPEHPGEAIPTWHPLASCSTSRSPPRTPTLVLDGGELALCEMLCHKHEFFLIALVLKL